MYGIEYAGIIVLMILLGMANIGGIGGGGLIIPVCIAMFGMSTREAIAMSNSTIFLGSATRFFLFSIKEKHPNDENKTLIDYDICSVMIPMVLVGSYSGIIISTLLPDVVLTVVLTILLIFLTYNTTKKAFNVYKKETAERILNAAMALTGNT